MLKEIEIRDLTYNEARQEIERYIKMKGKPVYISELASELHIDIEMVTDVMKNVSI